MNPEFVGAFAAHRAALLRHCYRMLGSFAEAEDAVQDVLERAWKSRDTWAADASLKRWLYTIATNVCLNLLASRRARTLPQLESAATVGEFSLDERERAHWVTPAPDARLIADEALESKQTIALAFVALLQQLPPKQRAAVLMKDVLGWSADEIAGALQLTASSVNSALHRGRETLARSPARSAEPAPVTLTAFVRAWESRDVHQLVALLQHDVEMAMPPHSIWLRGRDAVERFLAYPRFAAYWSSVVRVGLTRANGLPALVFHQAEGPSSIMVARFVDGLVAEMTVFVGKSYLSGFDLDVVD